MTGPKPRIRLVRKPRLWLIGSASIVTFFSSRSAESSSPLAKIGISVAKTFVGSASRYLNSFLKLPSIVAPSAETRCTLPSRTCSRNVGL